MSAISAESNDFSEFYERLKNLKDYHRRYPNEQVEVLELAVESDDQAQKEEGVCVCVCVCVCLYIWIVIYYHRTYICL